MSNDESRKVPLRDFLKAVLADADNREPILSSLTPDERRATVYQYVTLPLAASTDPNKIPPAPFPEPVMNRLLSSALAKISKEFRGASAGFGSSGLGRGQPQKGC